jgi:23S rRNA pseudouridine2605 synthase
VFAKLPRIQSAKWIAVGRLDLNSSGLLIFTTSGELANKLMHPRFEVEREYAARVVGRMSEEQLKAATTGVELDDGIARFDSVTDEGGEGTNHWYRVVLREGRKREVRRLFEAVGLLLSRLIRVRYGIIAMPARLKRGQMLELEPDSVDRITAWAGIQSASQPIRRNERASARPAHRPRNPSQPRFSRRSRKT